MGTCSAGRGSCPGCGRALHCLRSGRRLPRALGPSSSGTRVSRRTRRVGTRPAPEPTSRSLAWRAGTREVGRRRCRIRVRRRAPMRCCRIRRTRVKTTSAGSYTGRIWVRSDRSGVAFKLKLREYSGSTLKGTGVTGVTLSTAWQLVTATYSVVAPGSTLDFQAYVVSPAPGTAFYADDASLVSSSAPPPLPTVSSFAPASGLVGSSVVVTGTNLSGASAVRFGAGGTRRRVYGEFGDVDYGDGAGGGEWCGRFR